MERLTVFLMLIILSLQCNSQDKLFVIHPLVGDTIDRNEKLHYFLLREVKDSDFKYCTITHSKDGYFVNTHTINDSVAIQQIDSAEIRQTIVRLDKVMEYYANENNADSVKSSKMIPPGLNDFQSTNVNDNLISSDTKDKIFKEVRRDNRLKDDAERLKQTRNGNDIIGGGPYIEFFNKRHKKK